MNPTPVEQPTWCPNCDGSLAIEPAPRPIAVARAAVHRDVLTLWVLVVRPGRLTLKYLAGRRQRYVPPLRIYLQASLLFFLIVKVLGAASQAHLQFAPAVNAHGKPITAESSPAEYRAALAAAQACIDNAGSCSWTRTLGARIQLKAAVHIERPSAIVERFIGMAPYAVFVLQPLFFGTRDARVPAATDGLQRLATACTSCSACTCTACGSPRCSRSRCCPAPPR